MVRQFQNVAYSHKRFFGHIDGKLNTILVINPYRRNPSLVTAQHFVVQRLDLIKRFDARRTDQGFDSLLVPFDDVRLKPMFFVTGLALVVQFLQICLIKCDFHDAKIHNNLKNSQNVEFFAN